MQRCRATFRFVAALILATAAPAPLAAADAPPVPTVESILDQYAATQAALDRCAAVTDARVTVEWGGVVSKRRQRSEYRRDGRRALAVVAERRPDKFDGDFPPPLPPITGENDDAFQFVTRCAPGPGGIVSYHRVPGDPANDTVIIDVAGEDEALALPVLDAAGAWLRGWLPQDDRRIDHTLRAAAWKRAARSDVGGRPCVLVEAEADTGRYAVWFDPSRGGNIVKARIERGPRHTIRDGVLWEVMRRRVRLPPEKLPFDQSDEQVCETTDLDDVELEQAGGVWVPVAMNVDGDSLDRTGANFKVAFRVRRTVELPPAFPPDAFAMPIPEGTKVLLRAGAEVASPGLVWRGGRAVPAGAADPPPQAP